MMTRGIRRAFVVFVAAGSVPGVLHAQADALERGHFAVDGQATLSSSGGKDATDRVTSISLSPSVLYFVSSGVALGGSAAFGYSSYGGSTGWSYTLGPQAVVYFGESSASIRPFIRADFGIGRAKNTSPGALGSQTQRVSLTHVGAGAGVLDLLTSSVGIYGQLFYGRDSYGGDMDTYVDRFGAAFGFSIFLGS